MGSFQNPLSPLGVISPYENFALLFRPDFALWIVRTQPAPHPLVTLGFPPLSYIGVSTLEGNFALRVEKGFERSPVQRLFENHLIIELASSMSG